MTDYPCWVSPTDEALIAVVHGPGVVTSEPLTEDQAATARLSLENAVSILSAATKGRVHGPGIAVDMYTPTADVSRLATTFRPVRELISMTVDGDPVSGYRLQGQIIRKNIYVRRYCADPAYIELTYRFGSTVTAAARTAALTYAHELYLASPVGDLETCQLPSRIVSVTREGLSMSILDPQTYLDKGRTGVPSVDQWLAVYMSHSGSASRPSVYAGDYPPPVNISVRCK